MFQKKMIDSSGNVVRRRGNRPVKRRRPSMDKTLRQGIFSRSGGICDWCAARLDPETWECHHRQLRSQGGVDSWANLIALCMKCHMFAHLNRKEAEDHGIIVGGWDNPETAKVKLHGTRWVTPAETWQN